MIIIYRLLEQPANRFIYSDIIFTITLHLGIVRTGSPSALGLQFILQKYLAMVLKKINALLKNCYIFILKANIYTFC